MFVAIKGNNDGHDYIKQVILKGASNCVISKNLNKISKNKVVKVSNTLNFLKKLAFLKEIIRTVKSLLLLVVRAKTTVKDIIEIYLKTLMILIFHRDRLIIFRVL